jgi:hypothetical protein
VVVAWASPAEPSVHRLRLTPRFGYDVRIANDRIVFDRFRRFSRSDRQELGIADLLGHARLMTREAFGFAAFDYDGTNIVYVRHDCRGYTVTKIRRTARRPPATCRAA